EGKKRVHEPETIDQAAGEVAGLDLQRLHRDMEDQGLRRKIEQDYLRGVEQLGVFGTPTFLFPDGEPVFLKMSPPARGREAASLFETVRSLSLERPYVQELKKPRRPDSRA